MFCESQIRLSAIGSERTEDRAWRCDMHPAISNDARWLAFNGRGQYNDRNKNNRQVYVANIGNDLQNYFN